MLMHKLKSFENDFQTKVITRVIIKYLGFIILKAIRLVINSKHTHTHTHIRNEKFSKIYFSLSLISFGSTKYQSYLFTSFKIELKS